MDNKSKGVSSHWVACVCVHMQACECVRWWRENDKESGLTEDGLPEGRTETSPAKVVGQLLRKLKHYV